MGWTQFYDAPRPTRDFLIEQMEQPDTDGTQYYKVLDYAATLTVAYMAVECLTDFPYGKGKVFATVTLTHHSRDGSLATKDLSESMGVESRGCPLRILDKLSPIEELYGAIQYKQICDNHYDCSWAERPDMYADKKEHVNQRSEPDGAAYWATKWRQEVRERHSRPKVKPGSTVVFKQPIEFTNGDKISEFEFIKGSSFYGLWGNERVRTGRYHIRSWRDMQYEVAA
jgi:hypothetical protein